MYLGGFPPDGVRCATEPLVSASGFLHLDAVHPCPDRHNRASWGC
jgi:hypothetical protein